MEKHNPEQIKVELLRMQGKLKRLNHQMYEKGELPNSSREWEEYFRGEVKKYTDFANSHAGEIAAHPELKAIYTSFKNKYYQSL